MLLRTDDIIEVENLATANKKLQREVREIQTRAGVACAPDQIKEYTLITRILFGHPVPTVLHMSTSAVEDIILAAMEVEVKYVVFDDNKKVPEGENL